MFIVVLLL